MKATIDWSTDCLFGLTRQRVRRLITPKVYFTSSLDDLGGVFGSLKDFRRIKGDSSSPVKDKLPGHGTNVDALSNNLLYKYLLKSVISIRKSLNELLK